MFRLLTMNLGFYGDRHGAWSVRRDLILSAMRDADADVIALQAVALDPAQEGGVDQATQLARALGYPHAVYEPARRHEDGREEGMAFVSRVPVTRVISRPLSKLDGTEDPFSRLLLGAAFDTQVGEVHVYDGHFSWVEAQARDNVTEALANIRGAAGPVALVGDFNQAADSAPMGQLREAGFTDAWAHLHPEEPGLTFWDSGAFQGRIDYVWANAALAPHLREARLVADAPGELRASDHAGLLVSFA